MTTEKLTVLEDLLSDLFEEVDMDNPVIENDAGESVVLPTRLLVVLGQIKELMEGSN